LEVALNDMINGHNNNIMIYEHIMQYDKRILWIIRTIMTSYTHIYNLFIRK